jgi:hypothetical protein
MKNALIGERKIFKSKGKRGPYAVSVKLWSRSSAEQFDWWEKRMARFLLCAA